MTIGHGRSEISIARMVKKPLILYDLQLLGLYITSKRHNAAGWLMDLYAMIV